MPKARITLYRGNQVVLLPKEFHFDGTVVHVRRVGRDVVLSAQPPRSIQDLIEALDDFETKVCLQREALAAEERSAVRQIR